LRKQDFALSADISHVYLDTSHVYVAVLRVYADMLRVYAGILRVYVAIVRVYAAVLHVYAGILHVYAAVLRVYAAILRVYAGILRVYVEVLRVYAGILRVYADILRGTPCRGPTNTEPGAVATGVYESVVHRDCKPDKMKMVFIASPSRSLPLPVLNYSTHNAKSTGLGLLLTRWRCYLSQARPGRYRSRF